MTDSWKKLWIDIDGTPIRIETLVNLWIKDGSNIAINNLKQLSMYLANMEYDIPPEINDYLRSNKPRKGIKETDNEATIRDIKRYIRTWQTRPNHTDKTTLYSMMADEDGVADDKYLADRTRKIRHLFKENSSPSAVQLEFNFFNEYALNTLRLKGRNAERYALKEVAHRFHLTQVEVKKLLKLI